jgi:hypothetical protein
MSKLGRTLRVLTVAATLTTSLTTVAQGAPLVALVFGPAFAATIGGQILGAVVGAVGSYLFSTLIGAVFGAEQTTEATDRSTEAQYGERVSRSAVFGTVLVGGHVVHLNEYNDARQLQYVAIVGDNWHTSIEAVKVNNVLQDVTVITNSGNNEHYNYEVEEYEDVMKLRFHDGRIGQLADTSVVTQSDGWTSAKKFTNMAYIVADLKSDREKWSGVPDLQFVVKGMKFYDPRKDTTVGGSGAHRFDDPTTWEYSANPMVQAYHFARGIYCNGVRILGVGYIAAEISLAHAIAAMNVCDESVTDPAGGSHPRYECHMQVKDTEQFAAVLDRLCESCAGYYVELGGQICFYAGKAQSSVLTITDQDLLDDEPMSFNPGRPGETLLSGVHGTYTHSEDYMPTPYAPIEPPEFELENWYPHISELNYDQIKNAHQAYLVARIRLYENRMQATANIALDFKDLAIQVNDWITWNSSNAVIGNRTWKVLQVKYSLPKRRMYLTLQETSADVYDDDATAGDIAEPIRTPPTPVYIQSVSNLQIIPFMLTSAGGTQTPALEFTYTPILDPAVVGIEVHYRVAADQPNPGDPPGEWFKISDMSPSDGVIRATNGVTPGKIHEAYATLLAGPGRVTFPSLTTTALFPTGEQTSVVEIPDESITLAKLTADLNRVVGLLTSDGEGSVFTTISNIRAELERQANAAYTNNAHYARETRMLSRQTGTAAAAVITESRVRAEADFALSEQISEVLSQVGDNIASGLLKFQAFTDPDEGLASITAIVRATTSQAFSQAAWILEASVDGAGTQLSAFGVYASTFFIMNDLDSTMEQVFTFSGGEAVLKVANVDVIKSGLLQNPSGSSFFNLNTGAFRASGT